MTRGYELLTVAEAARALMKSEKGVRRLIRRGKLRPLRDGRRSLLPLEELERYAASLPHPVPVMAALYDARQVLSFDRQEKRMWAMLRLAPEARHTLDALHGHFMPDALPLCAGIVEAVKVRQYTRALDLAHDLERLRVDYQMLYAPFRVPAVAVREGSAGGALMLPLLGELGGGDS